LTAQPLEVIPNNGRKSVLVRVKEILALYEGWGGIVVGLPKRLSGDNGPAAEEALQFCDFLRQNLSLPIMTEDERLTSAAAEKELLSAGLSREKRKGLIDKVAAALILQPFLDRQSRSEPR
jgi:putative Holliday junction resolvase